MDSGEQDMPNLELFLITYNRKSKLQRTLQTVLSETSPLRHMPFTILDNASTDGTSEWLQIFCKDYSNIRYIRHAKNIGGNANITRAFEMAQAEYVWVLCDDDVYDFVHWNDCEQALETKPAAVVVANYNRPHRGVAALFKQLSFVPAAIYRTNLITADVLTNMYFNISNMFPQLAVASAAINSQEAIPILDHALVTMELNSGNDSYVRGMTKPHPLLSQNFWSLGYLRSLPLLAARNHRVACAFEAQTEEECFYNFCGRFMGHGRNPIYLYFTALHLLESRAFWAFLFLAWPAWCLSFYEDEKGYNCRLFGKIKFRICKHF